jgi:hypothetical protein
MVVPTQGMNLAAPANAIGDNELSRAYNWWYEPERGLCVRQGLAREDVAALANPIVALHPYVDATGTLRMLAASNGKLYERNDDAWDEVVATVDTDVHVSMVTFNGACLVADGSATSGILKYDGATTSYVTGSPAAPLCITSHANRVVCASASTPDYVYFSGPNDYTDWATVAPGAALTIAAGFGDGYTITGLATIYDALIVSKVKRDTDGNIVGRRMYAIFTAGDPANWSVKLISSENAAMFPGAMVAVGEMAYLLDTNGFKAVSPTPNGQYGDIAVDPLIGARVKKFAATYARSATAALVTYVPSLAQVWCVMDGLTSSRIFIWHPVQGAFTILDFGQSFVPFAITEVGQTVYLAGNDGYLYTFQNRGTDEYGETPTPIYATLRTRVFEGLGGDLILKKCKLVMEALLTSDVLCEAYLPEEVKRITVGTASIGDGAASTPVYEAVDDVVNATYLLAYGEQLVQPIFYAGPRAISMCIQVRVIGGRVTMNSITAEFAVVGR